MPGSFELLYMLETDLISVSVKKTKYKDTLEKLSALRNYAAHESAQSKRAALAAIGQKKVGTSGSWLKLQGRYDSISTKLKEIAQEIYDSAPY